MHGAGRRLDHDRRLVAPAVGTSWSWQLVGDQGQRPAPAGVGAVTRSAGRAAGGRRRGRSQWLVRPAAHAAARRVDAPDRAVSTGSITTRRPSSASATTSWPGTNGKLTIGSNQRDDRPSTVARSLPQMPGQAGPDHLPARAGQARAGRCRPGAAARPARRRPALPARRHPGRGEAGDRPLASAAPSRGRGPIGSRGRGPPGAFGQCSTCQPRLRAMAASLVSGLTATGWPTASSMGRSLAESA